MSLSSLYDGVGFAGGDGRDSKGLDATQIGKLI